MVVSANAVLLEEILAGSVWKEEMNRYHEMRKDISGGEDDHISINRWARAITWQMIVDNLSGRMHPQCTNGCDHHTFVNPRHNAPEEEEVRESISELLRKASGKFAKGGKAAGSDSAPPALRSEHTKTAQGKKGGGNLSARSSPSTIKPNK